MGRALNSSPKANFRGEQRGLQSMLRPRVVVESEEGTMAWGGGGGGCGGGGHHLRLKKSRGAAGAPPHTQQ